MHHLHTVLYCRFKKKTTTRLNDSTAAAIRLGDIAERKLDMAEQKLAMKSAYYDKKIILKEENNVLLRTLISTLNEKLPRKRLNVSV